MSIQQFQQLCTFLKLVALFNCQISYEAQTWYTVQLYMLTEICVIKNILTYKGQCNNINGKMCIVKVWEVTLQKTNFWNSLCMDNF